MDFVACESVTERVFVCVQCLCVQCLCVCGCILYTVGQQVSVVFLSLRITIHTHTGDHLSVCFHCNYFQLLFYLLLRGFYSFFQLSLLCIYLYSISNYHLLLLDTCLHGHCENNEQIE